MQPVAKIVTELFMMVLSLVATPEETKEFHLNVIQHSGRVETIAVRRVTDGFILLEPKGEQRVEKGRVRSVDGKKNVYALKLEGTPEQTFDLAASVKNFSLDSLRKAGSIDLKANDGVTIHIHRSGETVYLTPERSHITYACH